jgi:predicted O-methyltransferase YrrM
MDKLFKFDKRDYSSLETHNAISFAKTALQAALKDASTVDLSWIKTLPSNNDWALAPDVLKLLTCLVGNLTPKHILEFGSGLSTKALARACADSAPECFITSIDHDPEYCLASTDDLMKIFRNQVNVQIAHIVARKFAGKFVPVYLFRQERFASQQPVDLVVIDGPPSVLGGREGVLYQTLEFARPGTLILLDDANRQEEQAVLNQWQHNLGETIEVIILPGFVKGLAAIVIHQTVHISELETLRLRPVIQTLTKLIPEEDTFIFVDENQLGTNIISNRNSIPFLEKDGEYWGPPPDNETAINEMERLHQSGANFIVFYNASFWWLDYYKEFHNYLRSKYQCVFEDEQLVVFAL